ncbi:MAG: peptidyl-prolyl cis-trans isomerase [Proteobacteria bacterium]|nr:peptidyl-prolyl cis-trans isomerase [Pseudomonadota bacterium]
MFKQLFYALALLVPVFAFAAAPAAKPAAKTAEPAKAEAVAPTPAAANPKVLLHTSMGDITLELYPDKAPKTVENFLQYVKDGFYDGTVFHRVINNFMVQGGGWTKDLQRKRTRAPVRNEANNGLSNLRGTVAMARTADPNSAAAEFFVNVVDNKRLDYVADANGTVSWGYTVFGKVVDGMDVVDKIKAVETGPQGPFVSDVPKTPIVIEKASVVP